MIWALRPLAQISQLETQTFNVFDRRKQELLQTGLLFLLSRNCLTMRSKEADSKSFSPALPQQGAARTVESLLLEFSQCSAVPEPGQRFSHLEWSLVLLKRSEPKL